MYKPIRILHILHSMDRGGAEAMIMNLFRNIDRTKVVFDFLLSEDKEGAMEAEILALGGRIYKIPLMTMTNPFPYLKGLDSFFKKHHAEYKVVHSHTSSKSTFPLYYAKKYGIPVRIAHSHNNKSLKNLDGFIRNILKCPLKIVANRYFACAKVPAEWLYGKSFCQKHDVRVIYNAIDTTQFRYDESVRTNIRAQLGISSDELVIGNVGRLAPQKNHAFILKIFLELLKSRQNKPTRLLLIGDGPLRPEIEQQIRDYRIEDKVILTGNVNNVHEYLQALDVLLFPSLFEGLPVVVVEAQCAGLLCFVSKYAITDEISLTDLVHYVSLDEPPTVWCHKIEENIPYDRCDKVEDIRRGGYDIVESAKNMTEYYINEYINCESK